MYNFWDLWFFFLRDFLITVVCRDDRHPSNNLLNTAYLRLIFDIYLSPWVISLPDLFCFQHLCFIVKKFQFILLFHLLKLNSGKTIPCTYIVVGNILKKGVLSWNITLTFNRSSSIIDFKWKPRHVRNSNSFLANKVFCGVYYN